MLIESSESRGLLEGWYEFKQAAYEEIVVEWLDENGIAYTRASLLRPDA